MKVVSHFRGYDVYFKTKESAQVFSNYWLTVDPNKPEQKDILEESAYTTEKCPGYGYTMNWYPPQDVIDGYLELFPEEKEYFQ